jgi:YNFM family putative membrane transporter
VQTAGASLQVRRGTREFRQLNIALFLAGFCTFAQLYAVQPLLPIFAAEFGLTAGESSLALSVSTASLAVALLFAGSISDVLGRKRVMSAALWSSALLGLALVAVPDWHVILGIRTLIGIALSGVPAVAMAYLGEEVETDSLGLAMGLYIGGNAIGGMSGRLIIGALTDLTSWRLALGLMAVLTLLSALAFSRLLPRPRCFVPSAPRAREIAGAFIGNFRDAGLPLLFLEAFLLMGAFVTVYNYIAFRLAAPPYALSHTAIAAIFVVYLIGSFASAWVGQLGTRFGRRKVLWSMILVFAAGVALMAVESLALILAGIVTMTFGFFGAHSIASSWVTRRARHGKAQAASLYLLFYYLGSSIIGTLGGVFWQSWGWIGVTVLLSAALVLALAISIRLVFLQPLPEPETPQPPSPGG